MNEDYKRLDVNIHSSNEEIKKAYQNKAKLLHPDKGGNGEDFTLLKESYDRIIKQRKKRSFNDSFLQRDYINVALSNRFQRMEAFKDMFEKDLMNYTTNFYSETTDIIEMNGKKIVEKKINNNGKITVERYSYEDY